MMTVHNRAIEGWDEPVFYQGRVVGKMRKYSDRMLEMLAKKEIPGFRDKSEVDVNVSGGVLVVHKPAGTKADWMESHRQKQLSEPQAQLPQPENAIEAE